MKSDFPTFPSPLFPLVQEITHLLPSADHSVLLSNRLSGCDTIFTRERLPSFYNFSIGKGIDPEFPFDFKSGIDCIPVNPVAR
jgi:hypothetical protein